MQLRRSYSAHTRRLLRQAGARDVQDAVDLGCATGAGRSSKAHNREDKYLTVILS